MCYSQHVLTYKSISFTRNRKSLKEKYQTKRGLSRGEKKKKLGRRDNVKVAHKSIKAS